MRKATLSGEHWSILISLHHAEFILAFAVLLVLAGLAAFGVFVWTNGKGRHV